MTDDCVPPYDTPIDGFRKHISLVRRAGCDDADIRCLTCEERPTFVLSR